MQPIRIGYIRQILISSIFSLALIVTAMVASIPDVFAQDKEMAPEVQLDLLVNSATKSMKAGRWEDAVQSLERVMKLGLSLPGEFHYLYGKSLYKTGSYEYSLSSLTIYLTLVGRDGEY
ncbi:MAG: tetratricopeptide repeat protein, partial [Candidatus Brocadiales bacterium]|nr:tetratricopeptide repeat protein [Candidatus Brocadiales bacterium]